MGVIFDVINIVLVLVACINFFLGVLVFLNGKQKKINVVYSLNALAVVSWVVSMIFFRLASPETNLFWATILYISPTFVASSFLYFTYIFPSQQEKKLFLKSVVIFSINALIVVLVAWPDFIVREVNVRPGLEKELLFGRFYWLYAIYIFSFFTFGFWRILQRLLCETGIEKLRTLYFLLGYAIAANLAFVTNLLMPWVGLFFLNWLGQIFTSFMVGFTVYAIVKHRLMDIKIVLTQLFVLALLAFILARVLVSPLGSQEQFINSALLLFVVIVGLLLVRSVMKEVRQREHIEKLYKKLSKANRHLKELMDIKTEFLQIASHQLRTPLTSLRGLLEMQAKGDFIKLEEEERKKLQAGMLGSANQLNNVVNDLLDAMELEGGDLNFDFTKVNVTKLLQGAIEMLKPSYDKKGLTIDWQELAAIPEIEADEGYLRQVFLNIINNAEKYTEKGGLSIKVSSSDNKISVLFTDTGIGVDLKEQDKLFGKFVRGKRSALVHTDGSGLGLYIIKKIVDEHRGHVTLESKGAGQGTSMLVELPIKQPN